MKIDKNVTMQTVQNEYEDRLLISTEELMNALGCGRRNAAKIGKLAKAEITIGNLKRWNVEKIREFLYYESM